MVRVLFIFLGCASLLLAGCASPASKEVPIWERMKIGDLAAPRGTEPNQQLSDAINLDVYMFDIPAEDANALNDVWAILHTQPIQFNSYNALAMNLFAAGFSETSAWNGFADILRKANAKRTERNSLVLSSGVARNIVVAETDTDQTFFYTSVSNVSEGVTIGPGSFAIQVTLKKIPGERGVCDMSIQPVFLPVSVSRIEQMEQGSSTPPFVFDALGLRLKTSPGDYVVLGPKKYTTAKSGLAGFYFSRKDPRPAARIYMFLCVAIAD